MPSIRTAFFFVATAFAALAAAAPIDVVDVEHVANVGSVAAVVAPTVKALSGNALNDINGIKLSGNSIEVSHLVSREGSQTLLEVLRGAEEKLTKVSDKLKAVAAGQAVVKTEVVLPILDDVKCILSDALAAIKPLVGLSLSAILGFVGNVASILNIAELLCNILQLVATILTCILHIVGGAKHIILPLIAAIGAILCDLVATVLSLVPGLFVVLFPLLGSVLSLLKTLGFSDLVDILTKV